MEQVVKDILEKTRTMFQKYGIRSVSMDDIAKDLSISKKTIYSHFCDKSDLIRKVIDWDIQFREKFLEDIFSRNLNAIEQLIQVNLYINKMVSEMNPAIDFDLKKYYPEIWREYHTCKRDNIYEKLRNNMKRGKSEGLYRENLNEEIIARLHIFRLECLHESDVFTPEEFVAGNITSEIFEYHIRGIANKKGIEEFEKHKHLITEKN